MLFADEPTGSLDPGTGYAVMRMIRAWHHEDESRTVILVTHNFHLAFELAHRFLLFAQGRPTFDGRKGDEVRSADDLFRQLGQRAAAQQGRAPRSGPAAHA